MVIQVVPVDVGALVVGVDSVVEVVPLLVDMEDAEATEVAAAAAVDTAALLLVLNLVPPLPQLLHRILSLIMPLREASGAKLYTFAMYAYPYFFDFWDSNKFSYRGRPVTKI